MLLKHSGAQNHDHRAASYGRLHDPFARRRAQDRSERPVSQSLGQVLSKGHGHVIIDFSKVSYMDSTGISQLVGHLKRFKQVGRKLVLVNPSERIRRLLEMARLLDFIAVYGTVEEALTAEK